MIASPMTGGPVVPGGQLNAERVRALFAELSQRLAAADVSAQLFVVGGAAMALAYDKGRLTRDVDALFAPAPEVRQIAEEMSIGHGLEPDWLNDAAKGFLPGDDQNPRTVFESESLLVQIPSPEYLLAMKLHASRDDRDLDDAAILCHTLGYTTAQECLDLLTVTYPTDQLLPRHRYLAEEVATRARALTDRADDGGPVVGESREAHRRVRPSSSGFDDGFDPFNNPGTRPGNDRPEPPARGL